MHAVHAGSNLQWGFTQSTDALQSMQRELEDALISCDGQVENLEKEIGEQRR